MIRPLLLLTRPAEEIDASRAAAERAGFDTLAAPLLRIEALQWAAPDHLPDAVLFTSARAPALAAEHAPWLRAVPAYAVGPRTAAAASAAGFALAGAGEADGSAILATMAGEGRRDILHLSGADTAPLTLPQGVRLTRVPVYAASLVEELPAHIATALRDGACLATLLFSPRTARQFRKLISDSAIAPAGQRIVALSDAVAAAAGGGWRNMVVAEVPALDAALAAALSLWQGSRHGR